MTSETPLPILLRGATALSATEDCSTRYDHERAMSLMALSGQPAHEQTSADLGLGTTKGTYVNRETTDDE